MRHKIFARLLDIIRRIRWLSGFMGGPVAAVLFLAKVKFNRATRGRAYYKGLPFIFTTQDISALKEVLLEEEYNFLVPLLLANPAPVIADVGAHIGLFSLWCLEKNPAARILSVEASPSTFALLDANAATLAARGRAWRALHYAAWRDGETVRFSTAGDSMGYRVSPDGAAAVPGISLRRVIDEAKGAAARIDILKIDIEGAEEVFLTGDPSPLDDVGALVIELHPKLCDTEKVRHALAQKFPHIEETPGRQDAKPLLFCRKVI